MESTQHYRTQLIFRKTDLGTYVADIMPTMATVGIRVTIDYQKERGQIDLYINETACSCSRPSDCTGHRSIDDRDWENFPCAYAEKREEILSEYHFMGAQNMAELIMAMSSLDGVDLSDTPLAQLAALMCLREAEWVSEMDINPKG